VAKSPAARQTPHASAPLPFHRKRAVCQIFATAGESPPGAKSRLAGGAALPEPRSSVLPAPYQGSRLRHAPRNANAAAIPEQRRDTRHARHPPPPGHVRTRATRQTSKTQGRQQKSQ